MPQAHPKLEQRQPQTPWTSLTRLARGLRPRTRRVVIARGALGLAIGALSFGFAGCTEELPSSVALSSQGEQIEISYDPMNAENYSIVGEVTGVGIGTTTSEAEQNARNDLRNHAAALNATYVHIADSQQTAYGYFPSKVKINLRGDAFKSKQ